MYSTLGYLSRKASFKQINPDFPVTQAIQGADPDEVFQANRKELVHDFLLKAKQLEFLISSLPSTPPGPASSPEGEEDSPEFEALEGEMRRVNGEYLDALGEAESLHAQLQASLAGILETRSTATTTATSAPTAGSAAVPAVP
ncbi:mediator complex, subunit Med21 protein [Rhodotorula toruloides]|uniref:Mediator of RNA polymerase II transcription subunit 21 n=1 Tax=Rhodotorula toruloides TaxID=5286 RepID=A0A511KHT3_RHOTO|nr:mediator complex, subunit Med21 protein [Rhodotorula toruloides]